MNIPALIEKGFTEEQANTVIVLHKEAIDGNYIPKATFDAEREKIKVLNSQVAERDAQITELGKFKGTQEELEAKVSQLETANKEAIAAHEAEVAKLEKVNAVKFHIMNAVHDPEDVISRLDMDAIKIENGSVKAGLDDQLSNLKTTKPHYFKQEQEKPAGWQPFGTPPAESVTTPGSTEVPFGKSLAEKKIQEQKAIESQNHYFK